MFIIKIDFKNIKISKQIRCKFDLIKKKNKRKRNYKHLLGCNELSYQEI